MDPPEPGEDGGVVDRIAVVVQLAGAQVAHLPRRAGGHEGGVVCEEGAVAGNDGTGRTGPVELVGDQRLVRRPPGRREREPGHPAQALGGQALRVQATQGAPGVVLVDADSGGHRLGGGDAFQPQLVQNHQMGVDDRGHFLTLQDGPRRSFEVWGRPVPIFILQPSFLTSWATLRPVEVRPDDHWRCRSCTQLLTFGPDGRMPAPQLPRLPGRLLVGAGPAGRTTDGPRPVPGRPRPLS